MTVSVAEAVFPGLSVAVTAYVPVVEGVMKVIVKLPEESEVTARVVDPTLMVIVDSGAKPVPVTVTVTPTEQL